MTRGRSASALLGLPVRLHGIRLATPVELVVDLAAAQAVGFEVACGDGAHRFLPFAAARVREDELALPSALMLLEEGDLAFYRARAQTLSALRGRAVERSRAPLGTLEDLELADDGAIVALVVATPAGARSIPLDGRVRIREPKRSTAA